MRSLKNLAAKNIIDILRHTFRHLEASEMNQNDPHLLVIKGQLVRSIISLENSFNAGMRTHSRKLVA